MRSPSGKRVHLHRCRPGFLQSVQSMRSLQISRMNHRLAETIEPDSLLQLKVCVLGLSAASCNGPSRVSTCHSTHTRQQNQNRLSTHFPSLHLCLSCLCLSPCLSLSRPSYPLPSCLSLARCPSALTCQGPCAAQGRHKISVPVSILKRMHTKFGKTHDVRQEPCSGDHGKLLMRVPSQSPPQLPAGGLHPRQLCTVQRPSPTVCIFPSDSWVENTSLCCFLRFYTALKQWRRGNTALLSIQMLRLSIPGATPVAQASEGHIPPSTTRKKGHC